MRDEHHNYVGFCMFFLLIVMIVVVGSTLLYCERKGYFQKKVEIKEIEEVSYDKLKIEKEKKFVYYTDEEKIEEKYSLSHKYPVINLNSNHATKVTEELREYVEKVKKIQEIAPSYENSADCYFYEPGTVLSQNFLDYRNFMYKEYLSFVVEEAKYSFVQESILSVEKMRAYTFNVLTGELLSSSEMLKKYEITFNQMVEKVRNQVKKRQSITEETIDIEKIIENLKENETYILYIDESGSFVMKYIVKTDSVDYNDSIILNE